MSQEAQKNSPKKRMIESGIKLFAELSGHEVSNRRLAKEAQVNHAMINYHFGSRDGLCEAIFSHALEKWSAYILPVFNNAEKALHKASTPEELERITRSLVRDVITAVTADVSSRFLAVLLNDDLTTPQHFFDRLFDEVLEPFHSLAASLASKATGKAKDSLDCLIMGQVIVAQCMTFFRGRVLMLRKVGNIAEGKEKTDNIIRVVSDSVVATIGLG